MKFEDLFDCEYLQKLVNSQKQQGLRVKKPELREHELLVTQRCTDKTNTNFHIAIPYTGLNLTDLDIGLRLNKNISYIQTY